MATFQEVASLYRSQCNVTWWGYVGGFIQYNYHAFWRPLDKKVENLAQAILKNTLHQDALFFANEAVLEKLRAYFDSKTAADKTKFMQYVGHSYTHSKDKPFLSILERVGMSMHRSMNEGPEEINNPSEPGVQQTQQAVKAQHVSSSSLPPPPRALSVLFPVDIYSVFSLKMESSQEEKAAFVAKNFATLPLVEQERFVGKKESLSTDAGQFFEFLRVFYAHLVERCFGNVIDVSQEPSLMERVKKIQEWLKEKAKEVTTSLTITNGAGYLPWREMSAYENITSLDISKNGITEIPGDIGKFRNLQSLDVRFNEVTKVSSEIEKCTHLKHVFFDHNKLPAIPKELWMHPAIEHLSFSDNQIKALPNETPEKEKLFINVTGNPLEKSKRSLVDKKNWSVHIPPETELV